jgi:K+-transporting ATPase ATPase C chain
MLLRSMLIAFRTLLALTVVCGALYPLAVTLVGRAAFPEQAGGSIVVRNGVTVGSALLGQPFDEPRYFWGRPSALTPECDPSNSGGSNLGPGNAALLQLQRERSARLRDAHPQAKSLPPVELVTASGSGLDPHLSPAAARWQAARVATARGRSEQEILELIERNVAPRTLGWLGEPRVNVLRMNLELDDLR